MFDESNITNYKSSLGWEEYKNGIGLFCMVCNIYVSKLCNVILYVSCVAEDKNWHCNWMTKAAD